MWAKSFCDVKLHDAVFSWHNGRLHSTELAGQLPRHLSGAGGGKPSISMRQCSPFSWSFWEDFADWSHDYVEWIETLGSLHLSLGCKHKRISRTGGRLLAKLDFSDIE